MGKIKDGNVCDWTRSKKVTNQSYRVYSVIEICIEQQKKNEGKKTKSFLSIKYA